MNRIRESFLEVVTAMLICYSFLCSCGAAKIECNNVGVQEEDLMIVGYELAKMVRSVEANQRCIQMNLGSPNNMDKYCWRQLATTSGTQSVGGGYGEDFVTIDESVIIKFRTLATEYNHVIGEAETYYTSIIEKGNYGRFREADPRRVNDLLAELDKIERATDDLSEGLRRMTGVAPSGEWGFCNESDKGRAENYVLKSLRSADYIWEPLSEDEPKDNNQ